MSDPYREEALRLLIGRWESRDDEGRLLIDTVTESLARAAEVERLALAISAELRRDEGDLLSLLDFAVRRLPPAERGGAINEILFRLDRVRADKAEKVRQ